LRTSRSLCRRQFAHSSCSAIMDCLCWSDRLWNLTQAMALCRSLQCGASRHFSNKSAASLAPLDRLPPSRGRSFLMSVSDILSLNLDEDCAPGEKKCRIGIRHSGNNDAIIVICRMVTAVVSILWEGYCNNIFSVGRMMQL
jgi:hypothetical protein